MTITDSLLNYLKSEYIDERIRRSLLVNASREKIEKIDNSCKDEALLIYNLMSLSFSDKTNRYEPQIILIDGRRSFSVDDISDEQWSFMNSIQNEDISSPLKLELMIFFGCLGTNIHMLNLQLNTI